MVSSIATANYGLSALYAQTTGTDAQEKAALAASAYAQTGARAAGQTSSVTVTLSEQAKAALAAGTDNRPVATVIATARNDLDALLKEAKAGSALKDGRSTIDVSAMDRRSLWAVATNGEDRFSIEEQVVATLQMNDTRAKGLSGAAAAVRVTGDYAGLYRAYLADLDAAGPEEKAAGQWGRDRAAVLKGLDAANAKPGVLPAVEGDPVAAYLKEAGGVVASPRTRDIAKVASDVRAVLDSQYAAAAEAGRPDTMDRGDIDFSKFDSRSLAAVALNKGGVFSEHETSLATSEVKARNRDEVATRYAGASGSSDPSAFGKSIITQYAAMSDEERQASGWTPALYERVVALQNMSERIAAMFDGTASGSNGGFSLLDYL